MQGGKAVFLAFLLMAGLSASFGSQNEDTVEYAPWCEDGVDNDGDGLIDEEDIHCGLRRSSFERIHPEEGRTGH
jgi:hypothetical protein